MDISAVGAAYTGLKFAKDALQVALSYKIENETRTQISAALDKLGAAQDSLFELREELLRLQGENDRLRQALKAQQDWEATKARYQLEATSGGAVVYGSLDSPKHFACPSCFAKAEIQILQDRRVAAGVFDCPSCRAVFPVKQRRSASISGPTASHSLSDEW